MTVLQLKNLCKDRGLRISGNKSEVVIRLMESDEAAVNPAPIQIPQNTFPQQIPGGYSPTVGYLPPQRIYVKKEGELAEGIGICIIIYAVFRIFWALIFSTGGGGSLSWLLSPVAFLLGIGFLVGGIITYSGYRNGVFFTLVILAISGILSIAFHGDEVNPVSIAWGDSMVMTSAMCSVTCMIIAALPLMLSKLKDGWPEPIENLLNRTNTENGKMNIQCQSCKTELNIPNDYSGMIECPSCKSKMEV